MRQIVLDTETTGLSPADGHRIIEIAAIELENRKFTGKQFHFYINPLRDIEPEAQKVHGITSEFLQDKPLFHELVDEFIAFITDAELIIHNAPFDVGFLNHEFKLSNKKLGKIENYSKVLDTLQLARQMHPGQRNSLDALCKRYEIDNSGRDLHGALIDADLLALAYLAMTSGQEKLFFDEHLAKQNAGISIAKKNNIKEIEAHNVILYASETELEQHRAYLNKLNISDALEVW
jgi:DNA polymerase-3 subunit epsilon